MNRVYALVGTIAIVVLPIRLVLVLSDDLAHPERWDHDTAHDPRIYGSVGAIGGLVLTVLLVRELRRPPLRYGCNSSWTGQRSCVGPGATPRPSGRWTSSNASGSGTA